MHDAAAFEPYVMELMKKVVIPGLTFYFHDPVRVTSAKCVPALINCYAKAHGHDNPQVRQLFDSALALFCLQLLVLAVAAIGTARIVLWR